MYLVIKTAITLKFLETLLKNKIRGKINAEI